ncbi:MAG: hypothetical protein ACI85F_002231 [Bacteroidia bacterium]|jgi:hypothetical protein
MKKIALLVILAAVTLPSLAQHTLIFKDGEKIRGEMQFMNGTTVKFFHGGRAEEFEISTVRTIHLFDDKAEKKESASHLRKSFKNGFNKITYQMEGRTMTKFPKIQLGSVEEGVVVVDVMIDKYGNVKSAEPGAAGTKTSNDTYLFTKAKAACQGTKFNSDPVAPLSTRGKIWVEF